MQKRFESNEKDVESKKFLIETVEFPHELEIRNYF